MVCQMVRRGVVACDECTKNCIKIHNHEQRGPSSTVSFFKIMHGKDYSEFLYLPPKFARDVRDLVGQRTQIEDSNGKKWTVQFSHVDGALAFQEGWRKFVEDHQLEHGEILLFYYIKHGHFVVHIYGLSACEIVDFNRVKKRPNKRSRSDQETVFQDEPRQIIDVDSLRKPSSAPSTLCGQGFQNFRSHPVATNISISTSNLRKKQFPLTSKNMEDPSCMLHRYSGQYEVEDREFLFDLSNFETGKDSSVANKFITSLDRNITHVETQNTEQVEVMENDIQMSKPLTDQQNNHFCGILTDQLQAEPSSNNDGSKGMPDDVSEFQAGETNNDRLCGISSDALHAKPSGKIDSRKAMPDSVFKFQTDRTNNHQSNDIFGDALLAKPSGESDSTRGTPDDVSKFQDHETSVSPTCVARGKPDATSEKEVVDLEEEVYGFPRVSSGMASGLGMKCGQVSSSMVKTEPDIADDFVPALATSPFLAEVKSRSFMELPLCMPPILGKRERRRGKVVYLKDSTTRLWPVLYPGKSSVKAFTDGWKTFCKGNRIRAGDVCKFQVEKYTPCVFKVEIVRKAGQS